MALVCQKQHSFAISVFASLFGCQRTDSDQLVLVCTLIVPYKCTEKFRISGMYVSYSENSFISWNVCGDCNIMVVWFRKLFYFAKRKNG